MKETKFLKLPEISVPIQGMDGISLPELYTIEQIYDKQRIEHADAYLWEKLSVLTKNLDLEGKRLAVTVGSRGIPYLPKLVRIICDYLKKRKADPFIVPAMGSHGGATAEGQKKLLEDFGITEERMEVPILSSMEVVQYGVLENGVPVYCDKNAWEADGVVLFNKVKPHTDFHGDHESGMAKMIAIGLGKHEGASYMHMYGIDKFPELIPPITEMFLKTGHVAFAVGLVQNAYDDICQIEVCKGEDLLETDARLLVAAKERMAKLKFKSCDVLIMDEIGKNLSGNGYDPSVVGRSNPGVEPLGTKLQRLFIKGLSEGTHHNGVGISLADVTTRRCLEDIDWYMTWVNALSFNRPEAGKLPMYTETDKQAILLAMRTCVRTDPRNIRMARIKNTVELERIQVSQALYHELCQRKDIRLIRGPEPMRFDAEDFLLPIYD